MANNIGFGEFRRLLQALENSEVSINLRMLGEQWMGFSRLILLSETAMMLQSTTERRIILNLRNVAEFQIDNHLGEIAPYVPYEIHH